MTGVPCPKAFAGVLPAFRRHLAASPKHQIGKPGTNQSSRLPTATVAPFQDFPDYPRPEILAMRIKRLLVWIVLWVTVLMNGLPITAWPVSPHGVDDLVAEKEVASRIDPRIAS
jgi:hypothetical protein